MKKSKKHNREAGTELSKNVNTFKKDHKYKMAKSSEIAKKRTKQLKLTFLHKLVLNILNAF